jgi:hypothetical protein
MEKEKQLLELCRKQIEQTLDWGDSDTWTNDDFERLGEKIFNKTKIQLSVSTLKRIWGKVRYENFPATATLNALVSFLGYENWRDFRQKNNPPVPAKPAVETIEESPVKTTEPHPSPQTNTKSGNISIIAVFAILVIAALVTVLVTRRKAPVPVDPSKIKFEAVTVSDTLPNSVVFNYDASAFHSDSVFIQQSWDPRRREQVDGNARQHTSIYYNPGYFIAKLIVGQQVKKETIVNIQTKGWKGIIETSPVPVYLSPAEIRATGHLGISGTTLQRKIGTPVFNDVWTKFADVHDFAAVDPNNFTFETVLRNTSAVEASVCRKVNVVLLLKTSAIIVPLCDKGCISGINLLTGETWILGKDHDLSGFGCDFSKFQDLKFSVQAHQLYIFLNNKAVMTIPEPGRLPGIVGIRFEFEGAGEVKSVKLSSPGAAPYDQQFF